jgi:alkanesulfonate monooxygenase SsuD/methylene tetrahydromethanopterin reductase-like flavin-dependent oxidoreductase (luciferase family)
VLVAGSGEQRLLRIAAKHADMINLSLPSGDTLARIPHKLDVLRQHCLTVGRDPAQITVTYKATMAVAESHEHARAAWDRWAPSFGLHEPAAEAGAFVGEPADIAEMILPFLHAGVDRGAGWRHRAGVHRASREGACPADAGRRRLTATLTR